MYKVYVRGLTDQGSSNAGYMIESIWLYVSGSQPTGTLQYENIDCCRVLKFGPLILASEARLVLMMSFKCVSLEKFS